MNLVNVYLISIKTIKYRKLMRYYKQNGCQMFQSLFDYENNVASDVSQKQIENKKFEIEKSNHL